MQSMNDDDLKILLRKWEAPSMPPAVEKKILAGAASPAGAFLRWLMTGSIRVPAPLAVALVLVFMFLGVYAYRSGRTTQTSLAEFQPVKDFNPRIIRSVHEPK
jgi:hypothetical protein